ncbi:tRNA(Met) cytidine acetyltransferase TmcA domain-containing protein, partial [Oleiphilus sp. HI0117]
MLEKLFSNIFDAAQQSFCRYPVVLSGDKNWCLDTVQSNSLFGDINEAIYISASEPIKGFKSVSAHKVKSLLGGDCNLLLWDGFDGLSPDGLGGASGLVRGGGLFIIMVPPLADLAKAPDPDYRRMCSDESELSKT